MLPTDSPPFRRLILALTSLLFSGACVAADPLISEFMAANRSTLADEDGAFSDWIEIHNPGGGSVDLGGWFLTDSAGNKPKWRFPSVSLAGGDYLVVFASNKDRKVPGQPLHTNFALKAEGEYLALVKPDGITTTTELAPAFPAQMDDVSYGLPQINGGLAAPMTFLRTPTPGAPNSGATSIIASRVQYSREPGIFRSPFVLTLSGAGPGEHIRYVAVAVSNKGALKVPEPTAASPKYTEPLLINSSMIIRAAVFADDDSGQGPSTTVHYLQMLTSGPQRADTFSSDLPVVVLGLHGYGPLHENGEVLPGWVHLFQPDAGGTSFTHTSSFSSAARIRVRGYSSSLFPKKGYNLDLVDSGGGDNPQPLLGMGESDEWALVSPWYYDRAYVRNAYLYSLSNSIGRWAPRTRFVELFYEGDGTLDATDYAGISLLTERIKIAPERLEITPPASNATSGAALTGGYLLKIGVADPERWSFRTNRGIPSQDSASVVVVTPKAAKLSTEQRTYLWTYVQMMEDALAAGLESGWSDRSYLDYIDRASWVDQHLLQVLSANIDGLVHSDYLHKDRGGKLKAGPVWDFDRALGSYDERTLPWSTWDAGAVEVWNYGWYGMLARDPEFMQEWVDRWQSLRKAELSDSVLAGLADTLAAEVTPEAAARDAARWPDNASPTGAGFTGEITRLKTWIVQRANWIDRQFVARPAMTNGHGTVRFEAPAGAQLVYTLDGSDPRSLGGAVAPNAQFTSGSLVVPASTNVQVRSYKPELVGVYPGSPWSSAAGGPGSSPLSPKARLVNLSSRGLVGSGEDALIAGVVVADTQDKRYLARAIGPGLTAFGATDVVPDPQLSIFADNGVELYRNNGWPHGPDATQLPRLARNVGAFPLTAGSADSALAQSLGRGAYTLQITTPSRQPGIGLAELYELDANGRTVNLSTRGRVGAGEGVLIGGFVLQGAAHKRMLIRAVGPTLGAFGVESALADPVLTIYSGETVVATNDRWAAAPTTEVIAAASRAVGAFALAADSADAAMLLTLPPGAYTVEVRGKGDLEGVALLEIYEVP
jgi:hypothetical protein